MTKIDIQHNGLSLQIGCDSKNRPRLLYAGLQKNQPAELPAPTDNRALFYLQGEQDFARSHHGMGGKQHKSLPGYDLGLNRWEDTENEHGRKVLFQLKGAGLEVDLHWQFYGDAAVLRAWMEVRNVGETTQGIEGIAPVLLQGIFSTRKGDWPNQSQLWIPHNSWCGELRWISRSIGEHGLSVCREHTSSRLLFSNTGSWSTKEYLPMGVFEDSTNGSAIAWQIESSGSWAWEIGDEDYNLYLCAGLLTEQNHNFFRQLKPGENLTSLPVAVSWVDGGFEQAMGALTQYRRKMRRASWDNEKLPVIFNDYMNCLFADPTTEKERPLIAAAAEVGAEIYVIDAGWYAEQGVGWWNSVGEWKPSPNRFEGGIQQMLGEILEAGMIPGLWLELEVMGVECPLAAEWPDECFFMRHGKRINARGRFQLDYRHPIVRAHADRVVDRLVRWGCGYIKMDYNIDPGAGTELGADSFGDGLLQHNRAYLDWLDGVFERHPHLVIENCSSGGLRMDYALLSRHSLQSSSDQEDYRLYGRIACMGPTGATPEQQAFWSYPKREGDAEETIFNIVNGILGRIHQSGHLADLSPERRELVKEGLDVYKTIRDDLKVALPFWPLGIPGASSTRFALGLRADRSLHVAVWKMDDEPAVIDILMLGSIDSVHMAYPASRNEECSQESDNCIQISLPKGPSARLLKVVLKDDGSSDPVPDSAEG